MFFSKEDFNDALSENNELKLQEYIEHPRFIDFFKENFDLKHASHMLPTTKNQKVFNTIFGIIEKIESNKLRDCIDLIFLDLNELTHHFFIEYFNHVAPSESVDLEEIQKELNIEIKKILDGKAYIYKAHNMLLYYFYKYKPLILDEKIIIDENIFLYLTPTNITSMCMFDIISPLIKDALIKEHVLSSIYKDTRDRLYSRLYSDDIPKEFPAIPTPEIDVIYNNSFFLNKPAHPDYVLGPPMVFNYENQELPIGYNIHLPKACTVKEVVIDVYGGNNSLEHASTPGFRRDIEKKIITEGIAYITLNLNDLYELKTHPGEMDELIHKRLHACINHFFEILKFQPEAAFKTKVLNNVERIILYGGSFGGRTAVRHGELYPDTFDGYVSHDGWLASEKARVTDLLLRKHGSAAPWLDPSLQEHVALLKQPVLIIEQADDHNVNSKVAFHFANQAKKFSKADVRILSINRGALAVGNPNNKGHFVVESTYKEDFDMYANALINFVKKGPNSLPRLNEWKSYKRKKIANEYSLIATPEKTFIADALKEISKNRHFNKIKNTQFYEQYYKPLAGIHYHVGKIMEGGNAALKNESDRLTKNREAGPLLTDAMLLKVLDKSRNQYKQYLRDYYDVSFESLLESQYLITGLRHNISTLLMFPDFISSKNQNTMHIRRLLTELYSLNPELLDELALENSDEYQKNMNDFKESLLKTLDNNSKLIKKARKEIVFMLPSLQHQKMQYTQGLVNKLESKNFKNKKNHNKK